MFRKRPTEWIVVADGAQARILKNKGAGKGLAPLESMKAADGRSQPRDLGTDRPGRLMNAPAGNRHAVEPHDDPRDQTERAFAKDLIQRLERGAQKSEYDRFVLVAPPKFMGHLRAALSGRTKEKLSAELTKELIHLSDHELAEYLRGTIRC